MLSFKTALSFSLIAVVLGFGCDKGQSTSSGTSSSSSSTQTPTAVTPAAVDAASAMTELAATYNAVSDDGSLRRKQALSLKADGTVELDTTVVDPTKPNAAPHSSEQATGTYTAGPKEVVATFNMKDGKAIPASDKNHTMNLTREKGDKSLLDESGRTFERAK